MGRSCLILTMNKEDKIIEILEGLDIPSEKIDEIVASIKDKESTSSNLIKPVATEEDLKGQLALETDWRRRAIMAAKIINYNLEN